MLASWTSTCFTAVHMYHLECSGKTKVGSFILVMPDDIFACMIWPLLVDHLDDFKAMVHIKGLEWLNEL
jgi:hypothetical protein